MTAQEGGGDDGGDQAAIRVAHASPDAPNVDVTLSPAGGATGGGVGTGNDTAGADGGNETEGTPAGDGEAAGVELTGLGFGEVSSYAEVAPDTYQVRIATAEAGLLGGILGDLFGGDDAEDGTVVYDGEIEVDAGTTYTAVAFGQVSEGPASTDTGMANETATGNETGDGVGNETGDGVGNETDTGAEGTDEPGSTMEGFRVEVLEDDLSAPAEGAARVRVFHAVPDAGPVSISAAGGGDADGAGAGNETEAAGMGNETDVGGTDNETDGVGTETGTESATGGEAGGQTLVEELEYGATETFEAPAGDYTVQISPTGGMTGDGMGGDDAAVGNETDAGDDAGEEATGPIEADVTLEAGTVYSGFAMGYLDPEAADVGGMAGNETAGDAGNETDAGVGTETGNETGVGNETDGAGTDGTGQDGELPGFQLVVVQTSQDGERSEGGTDGLLSVGAVFGA
ncbi:DUF4397 domain-containing protein [Halorarum halobium]|uniref:DUF4397 domain-containing protein n=1 Tax=Halorarum halobium TaxID=3075121 RepID=UPI0028B0C30B|nr:DUF4397 domain-containing protein [Halobaculum sp. XH14]